MTPFEQQQRDRMVKVAHSWLRTPYHHEGRIKGVGIDCATLIAEVAAEAGLIPPVEIGHYSPDWHKNNDKERYMQVVLEFCREVTGTPLPGDIVLWKFARTFSHGAIVVKWPMIIHAWIDTNCAMDNADQNLRLKYSGETDSKPRQIKVMRFKQWGDS
jgi:cell wall-associated NlpC family hydrolase